jgi:hypothetical protein
MMMMLIARVFVLSSAHGQSLQVAEHKVENVLGLVGSVNVDQVRVGGLAALLVELKLAPAALFKVAARVGYDVVALCSPPLARLHVQVQEVALVQHGAQLSILVQQYAVHEYVVVRVQLDELGQLAVKPLHVYALDKQEEEEEEEKRR